MVRVPGLLGLGAAAALFLAACGSDLEEIPSSGQMTPASGGEKTTTSDVVELTYLHRLPDAEGMISVADIVAQWNEEHPDIQVLSVKFNGTAEELESTLIADVKAGNAPCLAQVGYSEVPSLFMKGMFEDVTHFGENYRANFSEATMALMTINGTVIGLPQDTGPLVYYYNQTAFDELGLTVPTTIDELVSEAKTAADQDKHILAFTPDETGFWMSALAAAAGATWYGTEGDSWTVNTQDENSTAVADALQTILDEEAALVVNRWDDEFGAALQDGSLIGHIGAAWEAPLLSDSMKDSDNVGQWAVAQLPAIGDEALSGPDGGSGIGVMKGCEFPEQAMEFANWFNTQVQDLVSQGLVVAATTEPMTTPEAVAEFYGGQDVFAELSAASQNMNANVSYIPGFSSVAQAMNQAGQAAGDGSGSVADILSTAQDTSVKALQRLGLSVK